MKAINPIIIIDLRTWNWTGIGRVTHGIYSCAQELENDFDIFYIVNRGVTPSSKRNIIFRSKPFGLGEQFEFNKLFRDFDDCSIILHSLNFNVPFWLPKNVTQVCHFYDVLSSTDEFKTIFHRIAYNLYIRQLRVCKATILAQSDFTVTEIQKHHPLYNVIKCPHGFNNYLENAEFDLEKLYDLTNPYFLYVGLNKPRKNLKGLMEAYLHALQTDPTIIYDMVVCGPIYDRTSHGFDIEKFVKSDPILSRRVHLLGFVDQEHLFSLYKNASLYVVPSTLESGFSYPALEALSCGTPVLLNIYDMYNFQSSKDEVFFFDGSVPGDNANLKTVLLSKLQEQKIDQVNPDTCDVLKRFSWDKVTEVLRQVYLNR